MLMYNEWQRNDNLCHLLFAHITNTIKVFKHAFIVYLKHAFIVYLILSFVGNSAKIIR